jgi:hypothetical protein
MAPTTPRLKVECCAVDELLHPSDSVRKSTRILGVAKAVQAACKLASDPDVSPPGNVWMCALFAIRATGSAPT